MKGNALLMYKTGVCERKTFNSFIEMGFFSSSESKGKAVKEEDINLSTRKRFKSEQTLWGDPHWQGGREERRGAAAGGSRGPEGHSETRLCRPREVAWSILSIRVPRASSRRPFPEETMDRGEGRAKGSSKAGGQTPRDQQSREALVPQPEGVRGAGVSDPSQDELAPRGCGTSWHPGAAGSRVSA